MRGRAIVKHEERAPREASARGTPKATPSRHLHTGDVRRSCSRVRRGFEAPVVITIITKWFTMLLLSKLRSRTEVCQDLPRCRSTDKHNAVSYGKVRTWKTRTSHLSDLWSREAPVKNTCPREDCAANFLTHVMADLFIEGHIKTYDKGSVRPVIWKICVSEPRADSPVLERNVEMSGEA
ncbi:hypothetical protein E2C01_000593 [Portunus trituberculatus]|uniref:Uncharacterized protein n=1 Tax=Portunus trituberculatus TaxID=210409 RepID=A0A5B7CGZ3_PORTR|nr:hypothetical protein [Portunus trituberculatus]